jgi:hypothetical protein
MSIAYALVGVLEGSMWNDKVVAAANEILGKLRKNAFWGVRLVILAGIASTLLVDIGGELIENVGKCVRFVNRKGKAARDEVVVPLLKQGGSGKSFRNPH